MNKELIEAINLLEKENNISKDVLLEAIENSLLTAYKNNYGRADNVKVNINRETGDFSIVAEREVVETVEDPMTQVSLAEAKLLNSKYELGDIVQFSVNSKEFGRIAVQNAKNVILQKLREAERNALYEEWHCREKDIVTGIVQRYVGRNISINLGKIDTILNESEQVKGEVFKPTERIKLYVIEVKETQRDPRITVSRSHPDLVKRLFESEVAEVRDGTVEIKAIAREAGSRTKMAVSSNDPNVDPVGACVGLNGARVSAVVNELRGEKIDIINWDDNPAFLIENALSPAKVILVAADEEAREAGSRTKMAVSSNDPNVDPVGACVGLNGARVSAVVNELRGEKIDIINWDDNPAFLIENALSPAKVILVAADEEAREAQVIVPDYQLSLAIGKEGQNARLAARLTGFKIDIKSETQARESGLLDELESGYEEGFEGYTDDPLISVAEEDAAEAAENEAAEGTEEPAAEQE